MQQCSYAKRPNALQVETHKHLRSAPRLASDGPRSEARKLAAQLDADGKFAKELARIKELDAEQIKKDLAALNAQDEAQPVLAPPPKENPKEEFNFPPPWTSTSIRC